MAAGDTVPAGEASGAVPAGVGHSCHAGQTHLQMVGCNCHAGQTRLQVWVTAATRAKNTCRCGSQLPRGPDTPSGVDRSCHAGQKAPAGTGINHKRTKGRTARDWRRVGGPGLWRAGFGAS